MSLNRQLIVPVLVIALGSAFASLFDLSDTTRAPIYTHLTYALLAIGLYGSVFAIDIQELQHHRQIVLSAITAGVLLKTAIIGSILYIFILDKIAYLLGIAVAQIDPLAVAALLHGEKNYLSERAKTILGAWSSFDDPMTVIISLYVLSVVTLNSNGWLSIYAFMQSSVINLLFAAGIYLVYRLTRKRVEVQLLLLLISLLVGTYFRLMLAVAIIGLFLRPPISRVLPKIVDGALYTALLILGFVLVNGISIVNGIIMACAAVISQIIAAILLTTKLDWKDRLHLAFAQQNGITAIILALLFETTYTGVVAVVAPAILFINLIHFLLNSWVNRHLI